MAQARLGVPRDGYLLAGHGRRGRRERPDRGRLIVLVQSARRVEQRRTSIVAQLHVWLAYLGLGVAALVGIEAGWRSWRGTAPARWVDRIELALILLLIITSAGGLGLLVAGSGPRESLHFLYAVLAIGCMPVADTLLRNASPRRRALVTVAAALVALVLIGRLFQTG